MTGDFDGFPNFSYTWLIDLIESGHLLNPTTYNLAPRKSGWWLVGKGKGDEVGLRAQEVDGGEVPRGGYYSKM